MVKKVELDTLEIEEAVVETDPKIPLDAEVDTSEPSHKWQAPSRMFYIILAAAIFLGSGTIWLTYKLTGLTKTKTSKKVETQQTLGFVKSELAIYGKNMALLRDFLISLQGPGGDERLVVCNVVLEIDPNKINVIRSNITAVRDIVYRSVEKKTLALLLKSEGKIVVKNEITASLFKLLGDGVVKSVYFDKFVLL